MPMVQLGQTPTMCPLHCVGQAEAVQPTSIPTSPPLAFTIMLPAGSVAPLALAPKQATYAHDPSKRSNGTSLAIRFQILLI